jgi:hypothetical protein
LLCNACIVQYGEDRLLWSAAQQQPLPGPTGQDDPPPQTINVPFSFQLPPVQLNLPPSFEGGQSLPQGRLRAIDARQTP